MSRLEWAIILVQKTWDEASNIMAAWETTAFIIISARRRLFWACLKNIIARAFLRMRCGAEFKFERPFLMEQETSLRSKKSAGSTTYC